MTAADWDRLALPTPSYAPGSWECGQLGLWGSGKLGAQPRLAVESKPRSVGLQARFLSLGWHKGSPEKALCFQASAAS